MKLSDLTPGDEVELTDRVVLLTAEFPKGTRGFFVRPSLFYEDIARISMVGETVRRDRGVPVHKLRIVTPPSETIENYEF